MAQRSLVIDASIVVKWFSASGEESVPQAVDILERHVGGGLKIVVPDLLYYEVANALVHKKSLTEDKISLALKSLFDLDLETVAISAALMVLSIELARKSGITVYDACYAAIAKDTGTPLVTANPRHQNNALSCEVIPIEKWRSDIGGFR